MKRAEAERLIAEGRERADRPPGYRVHFEERAGALLTGGFFPDRDEPLYPTPDEAWEAAANFALYAPTRFINIYVIDQFFTPVEGYRERMYRAYPPRSDDSPTAP